MPAYDLYGIRIQSSIPLGLVSKKTEVFFSLELHWHADPYQKTGELLASSHTHYPNGQPVAELFFASSYELHFPNVGTLVFEDELIHVYTEDPERMLPFLLGRGLSFFLEIKRVPVLHGSCFEIGNRAWALCGPKGAGKSSLAFGLNRLGKPCLSDDLVPLRGVPAQVLPGPGQWRLWPDIGRLHNAFDTAPRAHPDYEKRVLQSDFTSQPKRLAGVIFLEQPHGEQLVLEPLKPAAALTQLVSESYQIDLLSAMSDYPSRLQHLAQIHSHIQVFCFHFPRGLERLETVCGFLADSLEQSIPAIP